MHFTLGELLIDLVENAAAAGSSTVEIAWVVRDGRIRLAVKDDGCGMQPELAARVTNPFVTDGRKHPDRKVGLGLAFLRQTAEATGGRFEVVSAPGAGTRVELEAPADHVDLPPEGDAAEAIVMALCAEGPREIVVSREGPADSYELRRSELESVLGELSNVEGRVLLTEYVRNQEEAIWQR